MFVFNKSVIGYSHIQRGSACEDASTSFASPDGRYYICAAADGHGDKRCFRSSFGSSAAVRAAVDKLKSFAELVLSEGNSKDGMLFKLINDPRYQRDSIKQLTDCILSEWSSAVTKNYNSDPPTAEELSLLDNSSKVNISHIYGTTLIAGLMLPECLIVVHQGDGRCEVFYKDGTVDQPVPWDRRCMGTGTTSLCDSDASVSFRSILINTSVRPVAACFMGSDGIEDSYRDTYENTENEYGASHILMGGVHRFYKGLLCYLTEKSPDEFNGYLEEMLPQLSRCGSGDDMSVAGMVDVDAVRPYLKTYLSDIAFYDIDEQIGIKRSEIKSKKRKYEVLRKRKNEVTNDLERLKFELSDIIEKQNAIAVRLKELNNLSCEMQNKLIEFRERTEMQPGIASYFHDFFTPDSISAKNREMQEQLKKVENEKQKYAQKLKSIMEERNGKVERIIQAELNVQQATNEFVEFDKTFQGLESTVADLLAQRNKLYEREKADE